MLKLILLLSIFFGYGIFTTKKPPTKNLIAQTSESSKVSLVVLGTIQDAGSPHAACKKDCCKNLFLHPDPLRKVVSLGLIDEQNNQTWLFEATPDLVSQMKNLSSKLYSGETPTGIFLTHAHIGHYTGLMYLGREAMNANKVNVYALPKMKSFLESNGPWSQLVTLNNIVINPLVNNVELALSNQIKIIPFLVPHRDEFSETVGYKIIGPNKKVLFIPDIDKWSKWSKSIVKAIKEVDYAFIDATFFDAEEINNRNISEIPHPFVIESMELFKDLELKEKNKIYFIHLNHTNPLLNADSKQSKIVLENGFNIARINQEFEL